VSRVPAVFLPLMLFVAFSCSAISVRADPIRVTAGLVDAGFGPLHGQLDGEALGLTGAGLSIGTSLEDEVAFVRLANPPTLAPGTLADFSGTLFVQDLIGGQLDNSFGLVSAPFTMTFIATPTRLACGNSGSVVECSGVAPFTYAGDLTFTPFGGSPVTHHLIGGGTVEGRLFGSGSSSFAAVLYNFEASPTPEPGTLSLFTTGAIMAVRGVWRKRRAGRRTG
jgi:hypothetical protein